MESKLEKALAEDLGISEAEANRFVNSFKKVLPQVLDREEDNRLILRNFGTFTKVEKGGRPSRKVGQPVQFDEQGEVIRTAKYNGVKFKAGEGFVKTLNPQG